MEVAHAQSFPVLVPTRGSCPANLLRQISAASNSDDEDAHARGGPHGKEPFGPFVDWFKDHIELVGSPRPERPRPQEERHSGDTRQEAIRQVAFMAERYRAQMDTTRGELLGGRKARSSPDLLQADGAQGDAQQVGPAAYPSAVPLSACPRCTASCTTARLVEDAVRRLVGQGHGDSGASGGPFHSPPNSLIIFDWDDTLLPTTFILQSIVPLLPPAKRDSALSKDAPHYEELVQHAHLVGFLLRVARRLARVAIVTNSLSPWVPAAGARYLPGLDFEALLKELDIPVYYARRHAEDIAKSIEYTEEHGSVRIDHSSNQRIGLDIIPNPEDGSLRIARIDPTGLVGKWNAANATAQVLPGDWITEVNGKTADLAQECRKPQVLNMKLRREVPSKDIYVEAKRIDMEACVQRFYAHPGQRKNVLSIGDSVSEQVAIKEVLPRTGHPESDPLCKTVALLMRPTVQQLSNELRIISVWLSHMVKYDKDFDLAMDKLSALEQKLFAP